MNTPDLLAAAALTSIIAQRLYVHLRAHLRSRRSIGYLRYAIRDRTAHTIAGVSLPPAISPRPPTGSDDVRGMEVIEG